MKQELETLWKLQEVDVEIINLESKVRNIPKEILNLENSFTSRESEFKKNEAELQKFTTRTKGLEQNIEETKDKIRKYKAQLLQIKTNKEYQSLLHEISTEQAKISAYEEEILDTLSKGDVLTKKVQQLRKELDKGKQEIKDNQENLKKELESVKSLLSVKLKEREEASKSIPKALLAKYEQVKKGRKGIGIAIVSGSCCKGCNALLPPQVVAEVKKGEKILVCDYCGRILMWQDD